MNFVLTDNECIKISTLIGKRVSDNIGYFLSREQSNSRKKYQFCKLLANRQDTNYSALIDDAMSHILNREGFGEWYYIENKKAEHEWLNEQSENRISEHRTFIMTLSDCEISIDSGFPFNDKIAEVIYIMINVNILR